MWFKKIGSIFFILILFCGMLLIFSPNSVHAIGSTTIENWDSYVAGVNSGATIYGVWTSDGQNKFDVSTAFAHSGTKSLLGTSTADDVNYYCFYNFTDIFLGGLSFHINHSGNAGASGKRNTLDIYMYNDSTEQIHLQVYKSYNAPQGMHFVYFDVDNTEQELEFSAGLTLTKERIFSYQWEGSNSINYTLRYGNSTLIKSESSTSRHVGIYAGINRVKFVINNGHGTMNTYIDDIIFTYFIPGNTTINVYNESDPSVAIPDWNLLIYDSNNAIQYSADNLNNPVELNHSIYGTGKMFFEISASGYDNRTYYADIQNGVVYILDAFLPFSNDTNLYYIQIINEQAQVISNAEVTLTKQLNGSINEMGSGLTNAYGMYPIYLLSGDSYKINITADGYDSLVMQDLIADPDNYGIDNPIIYTLGLTTTHYLNESSFSEDIDFTVETSGDTLYTNYTDSLGNTTDTSIVVSEINQSTGVISEIDWYNTTDDSDWTDTTTINSSNCYQVTLYLNHTDYGYYITTIIICGDNMAYRDLTSSSTFDNMFDLNYGYNPFGWSNTFAFFVMISILFSFGQMNSGVSMTILGFVMLFINNIIGITTVAVLVSTLFILLGLMIMWSSHRRVPG